MGRLFSVGVCYVTSAPHAGVFYCVVFLLFNLSIVMPATSAQRLTNFSPVHFCATADERRFTVDRLLGFECLVDDPARNEPPINLSGFRPPAYHIVQLEDQNQRTWHLFNLSRRVSLVRT